MDDANRQARERTFTDEEVAAAIERAAPYTNGLLDNPAVREYLTELLATAPPATPEQIARVRAALAPPRR